MHEPRAQVHVLLVADRAPAHRLEMRRLQLAVDELPATLLHLAGKVYQRQFGSTGHKREHALAEEAVEQCHPIEPAHKLAAGIPHLDAGSQATVVHATIGRNHVAAQPGSRLPAPQPAAIFYHVVKSLVPSHTIAMMIDEGAHRVRNVNLAGNDDEALKRTIPHGLGAVGIGVPRKDAVLIGQLQPLHAQVAAHGDEAVVVATVRVGKNNGTYWNVIYHS